MTGKQTVRVKNRRLQYTFTLERNITVLKGDSATGKTTLIDMIADYRRFGIDSGVEITSNKECYVLAGDNWKNQLESIHDGVVFIDEGNRFISSVDFAESIRNSDNYYVIATRSPLCNLPYGYSEIYGIKNTAGNRYQGTKRIYAEFFPLNKNETFSVPKPDLVIVEDSNAGFDFYRRLYEHLHIDCVSANGNSNIYKTMLKNREKNLLIIADGAAFGSEIERVLALKRIVTFDLYLPECFEWVILKSGLVDSVQTILSDPSEYIESSRYFSWERYFTDLLQTRTENTYLAYQKSKLNPVYLQEKEEKAIRALLPTVEK